MSRLLLLLLTLSGLLQFCLANQFLVTRNASTYSSSPSSATVHWLEGKPTHNFGTTFGLPWPQGLYYIENTTFTSAEADLQSWVTGYWADGSVKWTGHAIAASDTIADTYTVTAQASGHSTSNSTGSLVVTDEVTQVTVHTGKVTVVFPKNGNVVIERIQTASGKIVGTDGRLVLQSQSGVASNSDNRASNSSTEYFNFESSIDTVSVSNTGSARTLVTVNGTHSVTEGGAHANWLPFVLRFYLYANSESIRIVHSLVFDGQADKDFVSGIGIRFGVPLSDSAYDRHVRIAGVDGGLLSEAVQGITGLRRDPGEVVRTAQFEGQKLPDESTWDVRVTSRLKWIPKWADYRLSQLSSDGFSLKKRTQAGQSWVKISGGTKSGGVAYLGGATQGGLAIGLRDFWKRYPTGLEIANAASDLGELTLWIYDPRAEPLDLRPYHDGLNQTGYADELDALEITYEDYEPGFDTPYGIARSSEVYIFPFEGTPSRDTLVSLTEHINAPPVLVATPEFLHQSKAVGTYWGLPDTSSAESTIIENHLDFLFKYYEGQVAQHNWYGFLDYGDFMHTYDVSRHTWRYDIGGYAWDNSELSPDLFFWLYFLRTGRADVYRFAEALTRHTGEVDVYHIGKWKGLGTRHGVQHFGDSAKQARISQPQYRKYFFYLSGGDERIGELLDELADTDKTYGILDPNRKVRTDGWVPTPGSTVAVGLGTDWGALAGGWLIAWERRGAGWQDAKAKLTNTITGIAALKNGFITGSGLYDLTNWTLGPPPADVNNTGLVSVSHLSSVFGLPEVISEAIQYYGDDLPAGFKNVWLDYAYYYHASDAERIARYGASWTTSLIQPQSRLTAYAAQQLGNETVAKRAWYDFFNDGLLPTASWATVRINGSAVLSPVDEASWLATNDAAQYGLAAIQNLVLIPETLTTWNSSG
ncbi:hypothetical protein QTJ16_005851 [Diplocarpon rosae]|uniref:Uncharacterized protein n=1 Tax=Diplocarpon rosae TaxID=946125 RepID=A0AAD9SX05_9HELO|nr:hypothetical protein QTJ16_005851 [Diplocarpon rosae]PBP18881.1 hypothetical protein BUE80_DR010406 [Diplocarpon rosae]